MEPVISKEDLVFNYRTLRLIIGALAFAFPSAVIALTGKITPSISASYHEVQTRDVFVGFSFIIGALLISYKGHRQEKGNNEPRNILERIWEWLKVYQEEVVSSVGGTAAIFTALYPTACSDCTMDIRAQMQAQIHLTGAFILFSTVVYFSWIAFLRSLNEKLLEDNPDFKKIAENVRSVRKLREVHSVRQLGFLWFRNISIFLSIASKISMDYDRNDTEQIVKALPDDQKQAMKVDFVKPNKFRFLWNAYDKKLVRGYVYLICGSLIAVTLVGFVLLSVAKSRLVAVPTATFVVETISLVLFGIAWMTASKLEYFTTIWNWWHKSDEETTTVAQPEAA